MKTANYGNSAYGYDGAGMRVKKTENGATTYYVQSGALKNTAMEVNSTGVLRAFVYHDGRVAAQWDSGGQFHWRHANHLGSTRAMTDENGSLIYKAQHDPYGQILNEWSVSGNNNLSKTKFTDYERDAATGLDYAGARMYNSTRGKFLQADPAGQNSVNLRQPQSLNRYAYSGNDPINNIDPTGRDWDPAWIRFFGESACKSQGGSFFGLSFLPGNQIEFLCGGTIERILAPTKQMLEEAGDWQRRTVALLRIEVNRPGNATSGVISP